MSLGAIVSIVLGVLGILIACIRFYLKIAGDKAVVKAEEAARREVQDDMRLRDVTLANEIRKRAGDVPDRLPPSDTTGPPTEKRKGRRGAL